MAAFDNIDKHRTLLLTALMVTDQRAILRDPRSHMELGRFEIVNTTIRDGAVIMGFNPRETAIPEDVTVEVEARTPLAFDDRPAPKQRSDEYPDPLGGLHRIDCDSLIGSLARVMAASRRDRFLGFVPTSPRGVSRTDACFHAGPIG